MNQNETRRNFENREIVCIETQKNQYGFKRKKSTGNAIERQMAAVNNGVEGRYMGRMLTLDIQNAFNSALLRKIMSTL